MMTSDCEDKVGDAKAMVMEKGLLLEPEHLHRHAERRCGCWRERWLQCAMIAARLALSFQIGCLWFVCAFLWTIVGSRWASASVVQCLLGVSIYAPFRLLLLLLGSDGIRPSTIHCQCGNGVLVQNRWQHFNFGKSLAEESKPGDTNRRRWVLAEAGLWIFFAIGFNCLSRGLWICVKEQMVLNNRPSEVPRIPLFVSRYAPVVWLDNDEIYLPSDMFAQIENTQPQVDYTPLPKVPSLTIHNLDLLNMYGRGGRDVFLTSEADITEKPDWLYGVKPDLSGKTHNITSASIIINERGNGTLDAFYMYFYAYNRGHSPFGSELGNHVGDWEHNMIRFRSGVPEAVWYSQHGNGQAFIYDSVEKIGDRPVSYAARGSHANYAIKGIHDHLIPDLNLPNGLLRDYTSRGSLWDPLRSAYWYVYDGHNEIFSSTGPGNPLGAMQYRGRWGDEQYPDSDQRQKSFFGFKKYVGGPTGPYDKDLNRTNMCSETGVPCIIRKRLVP